MVLFNFQQVKSEYACKYPVPSLRATAKQSSTLDKNAKRFSVVAYINTLLAAELKLLAMIVLYWIASRLLAMTDSLFPKVYHRKCGC